MKFQGEELLKGYNLESTFRNPSKPNLTWGFMNLNGIEGIIRFHEDMWITGMRFQGFFKAWAIMRLVKESTTKKIKPIKEHWASKGFTVERWKTLRLTKGLIADKHLSREDRHKPFLALANLTRDFYWPETQS